MELVRFAVQDTVDRQQLMHALYAQLVLQAPLLLLRRVLLVQKGLFQLPGILNALFVPPHRRHLADLVPVDAQLGITEILALVDLVKCARSTQHLWQVVPTVNAPLASSGPVLLVVCVRLGHFQVRLDPQIVQRADHAS